METRVVLHPLGQIICLDPYKNPPAFTFNANKHASFMNEACLLALKVVTMFLNKGADSCCCSIYL